MDFIQSVFGTAIDFDFHHIVPFMCFRTNEVRRSFQDYSKVALRLQGLSNWNFQIPQPIGVVSFLCDLQVELLHAFSSSSRPASERGFSPENSTSSMVTLVF